jgi:hypothetical protein
MTIVDGFDGGVKISEVIKIDEVKVREHLDEVVILGLGAHSVPAGCAPTHGSKPSVECACQHLSSNSTTRRLVQQAPEVQK